MNLSPLIPQSAQEERVPPAVAEAAVQTAWEEMEAARAK